MNQSSQYLLDILLRITSEAKVFLNYILDDFIVVGMGFIFYFIVHSMHTT